MNACGYMKSTDRAQRTPRILKMRTSAHLNTMSNTWRAPTYKLYCSDSVLLSTIEILICFVINTKLSNIHIVSTFKEREHWCTMHCLSEHQYLRSWPRAPRGYLDQLACTRTRTTVIPCKPAAITIQTWVQSLSSVEFIRMKNPFILLHAFASASLTCITLTQQDSMYQAYGNAYSQQEKSKVMCSIIVNFLSRYECHTFLTDKAFCRAAHSVRQLAIARWNRSSAHIPRNEPIERKSTIFKCWNDESTCSLKSTAPIATDIIAVNLTNTL